MFGMLVTTIVAFAGGFLFAGQFSANAYDKGWQDCWNTFKGFVPETEEDEEDV